MVVVMVASRVNWTVVSKAALTADSQVGRMGEETVETRVALSVR
jgi:hypothetical protein